MSIQENRKFKQRLNTIDKGVEKLKILYEQFFMGFEKREPRALKKQIKNELRIMKEHPPNNTASKFLLSRIDTKFKTYEQYWNRILREIEDGIYKRQLKKLQRQIVKEGLDGDLLKGVRTKRELENALIELAELRTEAEKTGKTIEKPEKKLPSSDDKKPIMDPSIITAYESFVRARLSTGESLQGVTPERFNATLAFQIPKIKAAHKCNDVEISVVVKNGKATLKINPRK
jgi:hypothetical protein